MRFAYIAAALLPLAFANPFQVPNEDSLTTLEARDEDALNIFDAREDADLDLVEDRDADLDLFADFDDLFSEIDARFTDFDEDTSEEENEIEARSTGSILGSLKRIVGDIKKVNSALGKFGAKEKPSQKQALAVQRAGAKLASDTKKAIKIAKKSKKLSGGGSKKVFKYVSGTVKRSILNSLSNFRKHAPGFKKGNYQNLVKSRLSALDGLTGKEGKALLSKTKSKSLKKKGKKILQQIKKAFAATIRAY